MTWWIPEYEPSDHELAVESFYDKVDSGRRGDFPERTFVFCFTNRSGSNFLGAALASTGSIKLPREYLNHPMVTKRSTRLGIRSFDEYLRQLASEFGYNGIFTLKAGLRQLYYLARLEFLGDLLPNPSFVLIERDDVVAQAVSWVLANQLGQWSSNQERTREDPVYDHQAIDSRVDAILQENAGFRAFLARNDCDAAYVRYEELNAHPDRIIRLLAEALELPDTEYRPDRVTIQPQRSSINAEWKTRYLSEVRR